MNFTIDILRVTLRLTGQSGRYKFFAQLRWRCQAIAVIFASWWTVHEVDKRQGRDISPNRCVSTHRGSSEMKNLLSGENSYGRTHVT
jgi:hypothetical protein